MFWSIIIPSYNRFDYLKQCVKSVISQKIPFEYEIIIQDDCSPLISKNMLDKEFGHISNIIINQNEQNLQQVYNIISGINRSKGEWIHILHDDDKLNNNFFEIIDHYIHKYNDISFINCQYIIDNENNILKQISDINKKTGINKKWSTDIHIYNPLPSSSCFIFKRKLYNDIKIDTNLNFIWDFDFMKRLSRHSEFKCLDINEHIVFYREHDNSESSICEIDGRHCYEVSKIVNKQINTDKYDNCIQLSKEHFIQHYLNIVIKFFNDNCINSGRCILNNIDKFITKNYDYKFLLKNIIKYCPNIDKLILDVFIDFENISRINDISGLIPIYKHNYFNCFKFNKSKNISFFVSFDSKIKINKSKYEVLYYNDFNDINNLIDICTGKYIHIITSNVINIDYDIYKELNCDINMCQFVYNKIIDNKNIRIIYSDIYNKCNFSYFKYNMTNLCLSNIIFKKSVLKNNKFNTNLNVFHIYKLFSDINDNLSFKFIPKIIDLKDLNLPFTNMINNINILNDISYKNKLFDMIIQYYDGNFDNFIYYVKQTNYISYEYINNLSNTECKLIFDKLKSKDIVWNY